MRAGIDATPLLGRLTGVGTYTDRLLRALAAGAPTGDELVATAFTLRGAGGLAEVVPPGVQVRSRPVPARALRALWSAPGLQRAAPVELLTGPLDLFHATNFVLPPTRGAAGVLTVHDLAYLRFPDTVSPASQAYRELVPLGLARADAVCTPSRAVADQLCDAYAVSPERVHVTPLGVDDDWYGVAPPDAPWLAAQGLPADYVVAVGTLEPRKNLARLLEAQRLLVQRGAEVLPLVLVGGAGWGEGLDLSGLPEGAVVPTGHLPLADLRRVVAGARLLVFPSLDEGFGLPPLEALACGTAVLAADLAVTREVLGEAASYVDATEVGALAEALSASVASPVGTPGTRRARAREFTWERTAQTTREAWAAALAR